ncbi:MAG: hypothetical protein JSS96_08625 [Bacteroidetes bacterium]|nr:hypothetical protein [Bacteroidota bacterium]
MKRFLFFCILSFVALPSFSQTILIRQNNTNDHVEYGTIAFLLNSALLNDDIQGNMRVNLSKCKQNKEEVEQLSAKFRKLYPGVSYGVANIVLPTTHTSDTITYEQTYFSVKKKKVKYYLQLKITFEGTNPDGEFYYPYITNIEVKGPGELTTYDNAIELEMKQYGRKKHR